jgi:hypothetical protein
MKKEFKNSVEVRAAMTLVQREYRKKKVNAIDSQSQALTSKQPPHPALKPNEVIVNEL